MFDFRPAGYPSHDRLPLFCFEDPNSIRFFSSFIYIYIYIFRTGSARRIARQREPGLEIGVDRPNPGRQMAQRWRGIVVVVVLARNFSTCPTVLVERKGRTRTFHLQESQSWKPRMQKQTQNAKAAVRNGTRHGDITQTTSTTTTKPNHDGNEFGAGKERAKLINSNNRGEDLSQDGILTERRSFFPFPAGRYRSTILTSVTTVSAKRTESPFFVFLGSSSEICRLSSISVSSQTGSTRGAR